MRFKIDENLPVELAELLRVAGHDAETVLTEGLGGLGDEVIVDVCRTKERTLVTLDLDFANIQAYPPRQFAGFIVLRPHRQDKHHVINLFGRVIPPLGREPFLRRLWIVEESRVRIRSDLPEKLD